MTFRIERVNSLIRREISDYLQRQLKDPRLGGFVSVTGVETSADLKYAKVFVSCLSDEEEKLEILSALKAASGYLRHEFTKKLKLRRIPELSFQWDNSIEHGDQVLSLLDQVNAEHPD